MSHGYFFVFDTTSSLMCVVSKLVFNGSDASVSRFVHNFRSRGSSQERFASWGTNHQVRTCLLLQFFFVLYSPFHTVCHAHPLPALTCYFPLSAGSLINNFLFLLFYGHCLTSYSDSSINSWCKEFILYLYAGFCLHSCFDSLVCQCL